MQAFPLFDHYEFFFVQLKFKFATSLDVNKKYIHWITLRIRTELISHTIYKININSAQQALAENRKCFILFVLLLHLSEVRQTKRKNQSSYERPFSKYNTCN